MATITTKLVLTSSSATTDILDLTLISTLNIENPVSLGRMSVPFSSALSLITANPTVTYAYIKNIDAANTIILRNGAGETFGLLSPGEFMFVPIQEAAGLELQSTVADCIAEYGYWTQA